MHLDMEQEFYELKFGIVPYHLGTLMTYTEHPIRRQQRMTNQHRSGIRYRLNDEVEMKMYTVDSNGNETIIRKE